MPLAVEFKTVTQMFERLTTKYSSTQKPALMHKIDGVYRGISYAELKTSVENFAAGLETLGVRRVDHIAIISENRPEWVVADQAIIALGAVTVPLYPSLTPKQIEYIFNDAGITIAIVSNQHQWGKIQKIFEAVKTLRAVIVMMEKGVIFNDQSLRYAEVMKKGAVVLNKSPNFLSSRSLNATPEDLLTIIYTSGTTGNPKGVMLTHGNLVSNMYAAADVLPFDSADVFLSVLPLCHSFEKMGGYLTALACGATIAYAESAETVRDNLLEIKPTVMTAVPRLFERMYSRLRKQIDSAPAPRQKIFHWAVNIGRQYTKAQKHSIRSPLLALQHRIARALVFKKIQARMGRRMRYFVSGGAALSRELGEFFEAVGLPIIEGYGLTESSPVISVNRLDDYKFGTVGKAIPGVEIKIADDGEILARGPNIMKGYWNDKQATDEVVDKHGWLHTGDIGLFDSDGFLMITDRKKHLFVSSGGKNIAPQHLENLFQQSKYIDQFVLIGDNRMFLSALIVPDRDALKKYAERRSISYKDENELLKNEEIYKVVESEIQQLQKDLAQYERVRKFVLLDKPFTIEDGEITPTLKVKRKVVEEKYRHLIEKMYDSIR